MPHFTLHPLGPGAAEITDLDCSQPLSDDVFQDVKQSYLKYPVLVFRNQTLSAPQLAAFGRRFGSLEGYGRPTAFAQDSPSHSKTAALHETSLRETPDQMLYVSPDDPDVLLMTNEIHPTFAPIGIVDNAEIWHSDGSHKSEPYQAILVHVLCNPLRGGDTEFCDLRALYNALPAGMKTALEKYSAIHHWSKSRNPRFAGTLSPSAIAEGERIASIVPEMRHPILRTHPETGHPSLYISPRFTIGIDNMPAKTSAAILDALFALMDEPDFYYRHQWRANDLMIWDNRCLNHRVRSYAATDIRRRHRVTVSGDRPFFSLPTKP